ncbi:MAG: TRAP transporter small permease [Dehalococcoidales bacterium]|nr:TRAP transporter small permease [Dehalococcoidales bacterium]
MKDFFVKIDRIILAGGNWGLLISGIIILTMSFLTTYGVGRRYLLRNPEPYSYELSTIFLVACVLFALSAIQRRRRNLRVDFVSNYFSPRWQGILMDIITPILGLVFVSIIVWKSWGIFLYSFQTAERSQSAWEEPLWPTKLLVPISMLWLCLTLISQLVHGLIDLVKGKNRTDSRTDLTSSGG